ncbi:COX15/CtaA family protein [Nocardioides sambongensis]|uniref:COX15/CtaA family protein n=1 Tax=Nocardioides sambongensis TaxID=2589074 RepID=UPI001E362886|nr:COX15/CtaA family protein [Nocardioides sambongensis]
MTQQVDIPAGERRGAVDRAAAVLWPAAIANLVANIAIVVTGGAVRLTGSGLGCPTWPRCTEESYVAHGALGWHGAIEFGNRMLTFVLVAIAIGCWLAALASRRRGDAGGGRSVLLSTVIALGIPAQAVIGGVTVLTDLNPWVVALHLLVSMAIIGVCVVLLDHLRPVPRPAASPGLWWTVVATYVVGWVVLYLGTVVTGSGPHSGDLDSRRTGLDPQVMSHVHAAAVYALVAVTVAVLFLAVRSRLAVLRRAATLLLAVELLQGVIGFVQYFNDLPELLVGLHMLGAALTSAALAWLVLAARQRD